MSSGPVRFLGTSVLVLSLAGCASTRGMARPSAFPTAPLPPFGDPPPPLRLAAAPVAPASDDIARAAYDFRGVHYRLGGESPADGFDCSGFVRYVFGLAHVALPRTVSEQFSAGSPVRVTDIQEGDLVFFTTTAAGASHVGIALADGAFIHAPGNGGAVRVERLDTPYWHDRIVGVRRIL
jgi:cell wall-associated NlpC family hydrolase